MEDYTTGTGQRLHVHEKKDCRGEHCVIHNPSNHVMRGFPTHWRDDRGIMERICPHGIGHPDPDDLTTDRVHGCCGCCGGEKTKGRDIQAMYGTKGKPLSRKTVKRKR